MFKIMKKYFVNKLVLAMALIFVPIVFIAVENNSLMFLTWISFNSMVLSFFNDYKYNLALPVSRKDIINGSYLFMILMQIGLVLYMTLTVYIGDAFFNRPMNNELSLRNYLLTFMVLSTYGLFMHPVALFMRGKEDSRLGFLVSSRMPLPFLITPILIIMMISIESIPAVKNIGITLYSTVTIGITLFCWIAGYFYSRKRIEQVDF